MGNFIVSARKYRPDTFSSVVGQDSIIATLRNTIRNKHIGHAYLFCGPRGVGKTTCARIFAKTINCSNLTSGYEPCNQCESCVSFNEMRAFNIHELDAASNNTVDDIRSLIDRVRIPPQVGKYSIYIIDEVHMLSAQAFNTFLKTLEEPPFHAIFILATTEKQKIIPTILSRCQIFDFNRIRVQEIVNYLGDIAGKEGVEYEPDALNIIALKADGAMRDALSIFDQMVSYSGKKITYKDVIENLNILDYDYYFRMTDAFLAGKINDSLLIFNEIINEGFDGHNFITGLSGHFRDLLVCRDPETLVLLETGATISKRYKEQSEQCNPDFLIKSLDICSTTDMYYKASRNQKLHVELALIKLCQVTGVKSKPAPATGPVKKDPANTRISKSGTEHKDEKINLEGQETSSQEPQKQQIKEKRDSEDEKEKDEPSDEVLNKEEQESAELETEEQEIEEQETKDQETENRKTEEQEIEGLEIGEQDTGDQEMEESETLDQVTEEQEPDKTESEDQPAEEQDTENKKAETSAGKGYSSRFSIKNVLNGNHNRKKDPDGITEPVEIDEHINSEPFSTKELIQAWNAFAEQIKTTRPRMYNTLKGHVPGIGDGNEIGLVFDNTDQQDDFQKDIKQDIVAYIRKALKNDLLVINTSVKTEENKQSKPYTSEEKYEQMIKKNPDLGKLKQEFNLDFE